MRVGIYANPHSLQLLPPKLQGIAHNHMPFDVGVEIECFLKEEYTSGYSQTDVLMQIEECGVKQTSYDYGEVRFRLPAGIEGMCVLSNVCDVLKKYFGLNPASGIHYHIDFTNYFPTNRQLFIRRNEKFILKALESWNYTGHYNAWVFSTSKEAVRLCTDKRTIEFRIGEMTFDYSLMMRRIVHASSIVKYLSLHQA